MAKAEGARDRFLRERWLINSIISDVTKNHGTDHLDDQMWLEIAQVMVDTGLGLHKSDLEKYNELISQKVEEDMATV